MLNSQKNTNQSSQIQSFKPWVEKYRPNELSDIACQDHAIDVLKDALKSKNLPHLLFYGPPGTGKTSTILALAKQLFGPNLYKSRVLELNASDERGIGVVRKKIKTFAKLVVSNPSNDDLKNYPCPPFKIIVLDEVDSMTLDAQSALRRIMEIYTTVTRFCLISNYVTRILDPLISRCAKFRFRSLINNDALEKLKYICDRELILLDPNENVLQEILNISEGDLRKSITTLQFASKLCCLNSEETESEKGKYRDKIFTKNPIKIETITEITSVIPKIVIDEFKKKVETNDAKIILNYVKFFISQGWCVQQFFIQLNDEYILNDDLDSTTKIQLSKIFFKCFNRLLNGTNEFIQLSNLSLQIASTIFCWLKV